LGLQALPDSIALPTPAVPRNERPSNPTSADDLICEEDERVLKALKRLSPKENYDRVYRLRRATQLSLQHKLLPKNEWTKPEEDVPYLTPVLKQVVAEEKERHALDTLEVVRRKGQH